MELPHIGDQCSEKACRQLDFLPVKCDGCKKSFCGQHWTYEGHTCPSPRLKDVQVPVCPMCDKPVPSKPGSPPDEAVSRHLDRDCRVDQKKNPRCSKVKCKTRELIRVDCDQCNLNYCLKHRHPQDHECPGKSKASMTASGRAAMARQQQQPPTATVQQSISKFFTRQNNQPTPAAPGVVAASNRSSNNARQLQGNLSEDEALARALQASMSETTAQTSASSNGTLSQEEQDRMLAMALAQSEREARGGGGTTTTNSSNDKTCQIS